MKETDSQPIYFNFPVQLLSGFLQDHKQVLTNVFDYAIYCKYQALEGTNEARMKAALKYFGVKAGNEQRTLENGETLFDSIPKGSPMVGLNKDIYFDYYQHYKTEFELACLLAFLALKSILQNHAYCKTGNMYLLSRMDGKTHMAVSLDELSDVVRKYANEYQLKKLKFELCQSWGLVQYSRFTRGFYVSFKLSLEDLVYEAEKRRKSLKEKQAKQREREAVQAALNRLNSS